MFYSSSALNDFISKYICSICVSGCSRRMCRRTVGCAARRGSAQHQTLPGKNYPLNPWQEVPHICPTHTTNARLLSLYLSLSIRPFVSFSLSIPLSVCLILPHLLSFTLSHLSCFSSRANQFGHGRERLTISTPHRASRFCLGYVTSYVCCSYLMENEKEKDLLKKV